MLTPFPPDSIMHTLNQEVTAIFLQEVTKKKPLFFHKRFDLLKPLDKFNSILVHHVLMQENGEFTIYPSFLQVQMKSLLKLTIQIPKKNKISIFGQSSNLSPEFGCADQLAYKLICWPIIPPTW